MLKQGDHRHVFVFGPIVIKIPKMGLDMLFRYLKDSWAAKESLLDFLRFVPGDFWYSVGRGLGFMENLREAVCYLRTRHHLLAPLYVPLVFLNVYKRMNGVGGFAFRDDADVCRSFIYEGSDPDVYEGSKLDVYDRKLAISGCSHTFESPKNFSYDGGDVFLLDYGEKGIERLLSTYGNEIEEVLRSKVKS